MITWAICWMIVAISGSNLNKVTVSEELVFVIFLMAIGGDVAIAKFISSEIFKKNEDEEC